MTIGRIIEAHRTNYTVRIGEHDVLGTVRGDFHQTGNFPVVGDYVQLELLEDNKAVIVSIEPRQSVIRRRGAEEDEVQVIAANVDLIFIVMGLDGDFNLSRLERYLLLAKQSEIEAVVILNKADLATDLHTQVAAVETVCGMVPVHVTSAVRGEGLLSVTGYLKSGVTAVLLGSSGAGKSTITNWLLGEDRQAVHEVRGDDSRGRHTTTSRQLFQLPGGGYLIDTPGVRELGVVDVEVADDDSVFMRVSAIGVGCKFRNCDHEKSEGCAVLAAVNSGLLSLRELQNYRKLLRERAFLESKGSTAAKRHYEQVEKRLYQKYEKTRRRRLSGG